MNSPLKTWQKAFILTIAMTTLASVDALAAKRGSQRDLTPADPTEIDREPTESSRRTSRRRRAADNARCRGYMDVGQSEGLRGFIEPGIYGDDGRGNSEP